MESDEHWLLNRISKSALSILSDLRDYASKHNNRPGYEVVSRFRKKLEHDELTERDLPLPRIISTLERFEKHTISRSDLLIEFLWILETYGEVIKKNELSQKIDDELRQLEQQHEQSVRAQSVLTIDFTEISAANTDDGRQDTFEMFARDFLLVLGFEIEEGPGRGADGGKDLLVIEPFSGILTSTKKRWIVSCKHFAHSGQSVGINDEINISDRVKKFNAEGFMAFYSTIPSSQLNDTFSRLQGGFAVTVLDRAKIEHLLVSDERLEAVVARYFRQTYRDKLIRRKGHSFEKALLFLEYEKKRKQQEAEIRNDATNFVRAEREYQRKLQLLKHQQDVEIKFLEDD